MSLREDKIRRCFFLCFSYKIPTNEFNMLENKLLFIFSCTHWLRHPFVVIIKEAKNNLWEGLAAGGMMGDAGAQVMLQPVK